MHWFLCFISVISAPTALYDDDTSQKKVNIALLIFLSSLTGFIHCQLENKMNPCDFLSRRPAISGHQMDNRPRDFGEIFRLAISPLTLQLDRFVANKVTTLFLGGVD